VREQQLEHASAGRRAASPRPASPSRTALILPTRSGCLTRTKHIRHFPVAVVSNSARICPSRLLALGFACRILVLVSSFFLVLMKGNARPPSRSPSLRRELQAGAGT
jgi:hypothetical protein